jgi:Tfp pilus assembly pilus retraction ATPase PilT
MYAMDQLLRLAHSSGAGELSLVVGQPPILVFNGREEPIEGPALTKEDAEYLFRSMSDTRQRRELRENGTVEFIFRFRQHTFVVGAKVTDESIYMAIH